ncbi:MAG: spore cortex-lytic enzyme [Clostridiales bacterium]|nr:spore cortex-lytic enzyme [Clostridiales bacterium]
MKKKIKKAVITAALCVGFSSAAVLGIDQITGSAKSTQIQTYASQAEENIVAAAILRQGSKGGEVKEVQRRLKTWGYYKGSVDGVFGAGTKSAVVAFQKKNGLQADGVVGASTYKALGMTGSYNVLVGQNGSSGSASADATNGFSSSDVYLLAKTIYAEGRGEPYTGQVAIGAVVLNRIRSPQFPNTVSGVVYQKHAFTAVTDGQINLTPNDTAMKAAKDAINGWDPTGGALYYYNPAVATSSWIFDRQTVTVIGKHVFAI